MGEVRFFFDRQPCPCCDQPPLIMMCCGTCSVIVAFCGEVDESIGAYEKPLSLGFQWDGDSSGKHQRSCPACGAHSGVRYASLSELQAFGFAQGDVREYDESDGYNGPCRVWD